MESYRFCNYDEAIEMLQSLKKREKNRKIVIFTIDFDKDMESSGITTPEEGCILIKRSKTIIINEDKYIPHMQLFSTFQTDIKNVVKKGIMHDILVGSG